jgi:hypothetical protein
LNHSLTYQEALLANYAGVFFGFRAREVTCDVKLSERLRRFKLAYFVKSSSVRPVSCDLLGFLGFLLPSSLASSSGVPVELKFRVSVVGVVCFSLVCVCLTPPSSGGYPGLRGPRQQVSVSLLASVSRLAALSYSMFWSILVRSVMRAKRMKARLPWSFNRACCFFPLLSLRVLRAIEFLRE